MTQTATKSCRRCGETKPVEEFVVDRHTRDGRHSRCLRCNREAVADWRRRNPKRFRALRRQYTERTTLTARAKWAAIAAENARDVGR